MKHPIQQIIDITYGTINSFADDMKITRQTAAKFYKKPDLMRYAHVRKLCKRSKQPIEKFLDKVAKQLGEELP
jgi:hypothetical protein